MAKIRKVHELSLARFHGILFGVIGLGAGILYSFGGFIIDLSVTMGWITSTETPGLSYGTVLAFGALVGMPIIFATFGFIVGLIEAFLYNLFARGFGGIEIDFEQ